MWQHRLTQALVVLGLSAAFVMGMQQAAVSERRPIFGETPADVESYLGQYWTRLTTTNETGDRVVTYTYSPGPIRSLFNNAEDLRVSIRFVNDRAELIRIHQNSGGFNIPPNPDPSSDDLTYVFDQVFESLFETQPPINSPSYQRVLEPGALHGTLHTVTYCMSEEIAVSYEWISNPDYIWFVLLFPEPSCR